MSKDIFIIKNSTSEGPGILKDILIEKNLNFSIIDLNSGDKFPAIDKINAVVILGGPDSANDQNPKMQEEIVFIREILSESIPYLGICLGMQSLVKAAGGMVIKSPVKETGFRDPGGNLFTIKLTREGGSDPLFDQLALSLNVFHLHGETVELSRNITLLATGEYCVNQVVKVGKNAYGIQCHFELTREMFKSWVDEDPDLLKLDKTGLWNDYSSLEDGYNRTGRKLLENFLKISGY